MQNYYICDEVSHEIWGLFELWLLSVILNIVFQVLELGPGRTRGQTCLCWINILLKFLFLVKTILAWEGCTSLQICQNNMSTGEYLMHTPAKIESR